MKNEWYLLFDKKVGKECKKFRKNHNYTQKQLADILGISREHLARYEGGQVHSNKITSKLNEMGMEVII